MAARWSISIELPIGAKTAVSPVIVVVA
jgi:hypothetical protein